MSYCQICRVLLAYYLLSILSRLSVGAAERRVSHTSKALTGSVVSVVRRPVRVIQFKSRLLTADMF